MKTPILTLCLLFIVSTAFAGTRVHYNGEDVTRISKGSPIAGALYYNDDSPDYSQKKALWIATPKKFLKVVGGELVERTQAEKDAILQAEADAQVVLDEHAIQNYQVSNLELLTALVQRINVRIPNNPITKKEIIDQIKANR